MANRSEIEIIQMVYDALSELGDDDARKRVLAWANAKFLGTSPAPAQALSPVAADAERAAGKKRKGKAKVVLKQVKDLNLQPSGKKSARAFAEEKAPTNQKQKCVVAVYYLLNVLGLAKVGADHVYTFFKGVEWPAPANLPNTLHQAGSAGWLDTADSDDLKVTPIGENLVEHNLPNAKATP